MEQLTATRNTVKGHGLTVGDHVNMHGMGNDGFPTIEGTLCVLGKDGGKYTLTSVNEMSGTGTPFVWTFGAAAQVWLSPVEKVEITEVAAIVRAASDVAIAEVKATETVGPELPLAAWEVELMAPEVAEVNPSEITAGWTFTSNGEVYEITERAGQAIYAVRVADVNNPDGPFTTWELSDVARLSPVAPQVPGWVAELADMGREYAVTCQGCGEGARTHEVRTDGQYLGSMGVPQSPTLHVCEPCAQMIMGTVSVDGSGMPSVHIVWHETSPDGQPYTRTFAEPACRIYVCTTGRQADKVARRVSPNLHIPTSAHLVSWISGGIWDGGPCPVAVGDIVVGSKGSALVTGMGYGMVTLDNDTYGHFAKKTLTRTQVRLWVEADCLSVVRGRTARVGDMVYRDRDGAQGTVTQVLTGGSVDGDLMVTFPDGGWDVNSPDEWAGQGYEVIAAAEVAEGERMALGLGVKPMSATTADVLMPQGPRSACHCGNPAHIPTMAQHIRTNLKRRSRKSARRARRGLTGGVK